MEEVEKLNKPKQNSRYTDQIVKKPENYAAKLAIIAGAITTFGDALATVAAALALEETVASDNKDQQSQNNQEEKMLSMQKQIDSLTLQLKKISKK